MRLAGFVFFAFVAGLELLCKHRVKLDSGSADYGCRRKDDYSLLIVAIGHPPSRPRVERSSAGVRAVRDIIRNS